MTKSETALWVAISNNNASGLREILDDTPQLATVSVPSSPWKYEIEEGYPNLSRPIHFCSLSGRETLLAILLEFPVDLEAIAFEENKGLTTALVLAAWEGSLESCHLLLNAGANPNTCASTESPLYTAAEHHAWDKVDLLLAHGAKHDVFTACICGQLDIVQAEIHAYPLLADRRSLKRGRTPIEESIAHDCHEITAWLTELEGSEVSAS